MAVQDAQVKMLMWVVGSVAAGLFVGVQYMQGQMEAQAIRINERCSKDLADTNAEWRTRIEAAETAFERELVAARGQIDSCRQMGIMMLDAQREDCMEDRKNQRTANMQAVLRLMEILEKREK